MGRYMALPPSAAEVAAGQLTQRALYTGPDMPPAPGDEDTGSDGRGYVYRQDAQATSWHVSHGLGYYPSVTAQTEPGEVDVVVEVEHLNTSQLILRFTAPQNGVAWLSKAVL